MITNSHTDHQTRCLEEIRCHCGQLIARVIEGGLELKCKRCRRLIVIPFDSIGGWPTN